MAKFGTYTGSRRSMKTIVPFLIGSIFFLHMDVFSQNTRYLVRFRDKAGNDFSLNDPTPYLSQRALDKRNRYGIPIDSFDLPVTRKYIDSIRLVPNVTVLNASKWLNQVSIQTTDASAISKINAFPFVLGTAEIAARKKSNRDREPNENDLITEPGTRVKGNFFNYGNSAVQVNMHNGNFLHNIGLRGQGMVIGMLDGGFQNFSSLKAFDSVRINGQILGTWDFVVNEANVENDISHGMECASIIAANIPGQFVGTAPKSGFYFFKTEDASSEYPIEEHNWVCGAERVDSAGGDVISSSVGYYDFDDPSFNYNYSTDFNGRTTISARGAVIAARKGLLIFNSAGNEGNNTWKFIVTPADADSIIAVGAVNKDSIVASFSSFGPSADGRVKPDVASMGVATIIQLPSNTIGSSNGTSYSCPNIAGLGACLWQGFPEFDNIHIIRALKESSDRFTNPDNRTGYGIPDMKKAFLLLVHNYSTASLTVNSCVSEVNWSSKDVESMRYEIERKLPGESSFNKIASLPAQPGLILNSNAYQFKDTLTNAQAGTISYRIRQVIDTSVASFSAGYIDTVEVQLGSSCVTTGIDPSGQNRDMITLMPNPTSGSSLLKVETNNPIPVLYIRVSDMKGSTLLQLRKSAGPGVSFFEIPTANLPKGKYTITVYDNKSFLTSRELIKL